MKTISFILILLGCFFIALPAHALYFDGSDGDGYNASDVGYTRSWGFTGGSGRGDLMLAAGNQTLMTFTSAAAQSFTVGGDSTLASVITIRQDAAVGAGIVTGDQLQVTIPYYLGMTWNPITPLTITGGHLSGVPAYTNGNKTLVLSVTSDFADGDTVTVSGAEFNNFTVGSIGSLWLDITSGTGAYDIDPMDKTITATERLTGFIGGEGRGDMVLDINQHPRSVIDFGTHF
jgi:hypothetical protein